MRYRLFAARDGDTLVEEFQAEDEDDAEAKALPLMCAEFREQWLSYEEAIADCDGVRLEAIVVDPTVETHTIGVLSTGHLMEETAQALRGTEFGFTVGEFPEGAFVSCLLVPDQNPNGEQWPDLHAVRLWAARRGYGYVLLDRDAEKVDDLPYYEW